MLRKCREGWRRRLKAEERKQKRAHAITLRRQGWTEQAIASEVGIPRSTVSDWLKVFFADNATLGKTVKSWHIADNRSPRIIGKNLQFRSFLGKLEDFQTDIRFPLIIADPPGYQ